MTSPADIMELRTITQGVYVDDKCVIMKFDIDMLTDDEIKNIAGMSLFRRRVAVILRLEPQEQRGLRRGDMGTRTYLCGCTYSLWPEPGSKCPKHGELTLGTTYG
jgi:hypothetical protein